MEPENVSFEGFENLDSYLNNLIERVEFEVSCRYQQMRYLGKELRSLIETGGIMEEKDRLFLQETFGQAVFLFAETTFDDPIAKSTNEDSKVYFYIQRDAFFYASKNLCEHNREECEESLSAVINFFECGKCTEEQTLPVLRFIAFTVMELSKELKPFKT